MKSEKGITLLALVITIIVLLILAGVSISLALSQNGVLIKAEEAREKTEIAEIREKLQLLIVEKQVDAYAEGKEITKPEILDILGLAEDGDEEIEFEGFKFKINESLTVIEVK